MNDRPIESDVRTRLMLAALSHFTRRGYAATTVREIVATAGVTKPVLYYYFTSKEGLFLALLQESFVAFEGMLNEFVSTPGPARQRLLRYCRSIFDSALANIEVVRLSYAIYYGPPQGTPFFDFEGFFQKMLDGISIILKEGMEQGEFRRLPCHELTWAVMGILNVSMQEQICQGIPRINGEGMTTALTILLDGINAGEAV